MEVKFNVTGTERKALVTAIAEITGATAAYKGAPTFNYEVDYFTIDKNGILSFDDRADSEEIEHLLESLEQKGFTAEQPEVTECEATPVDEPSESIGLTVELPIEKVAVGNLTNLLDAKGGLIKMALGIDALPIEISEDRISFPWFSKLPDADTAKAYTHFIAALCEMSVKQKRITAKEKAVDNEKYAFRCFLLRLGFIGAEFKAERKILMQNLSGSAAFKSGAKKEAADDEISE